MYRNKQGEWVEGYKKPVSVYQPKGPVRAVALDEDVWSEEFLQMKSAHSNVSVDDKEPIVFEALKDSNEPYLHIKKSIKTNQLLFPPAERIKL